MDTTFTLNQLLKYAYQPIPPELVLEMMDVFEKEPEYRDFYEGILETKKQLNKELQDPSPSSIKIIMDHSRKTGNRLESAY